MTEQKLITLITGASGGIGEYLAYQFAAQGEDLLLVARSEDKLQKLSAKIEARYKVKVAIFTLDLSAQNACDRLDKYVNDNGFSVKHLVNNAGFGLNGSMAKLDSDEQLNMIDLNVRALADLSLRYLADVTKNAGGIMNVASTISFMAAPYMGVYGATKAFVLSFTEALAQENVNKNIKISAICPGPTKTGFGVRSHIDRSDLFDYVPTMSAEEVAKIAFQGYMRGQVIVVTGISNKPLPYLVRLTPRWMLRKIASRLMSTER